VVRTVTVPDRRRRRPPDSFMPMLESGHTGARWHNTRTARAAAPHDPLTASRQPPSRLRLATVGAPRANTAASPKGRSPSHSSTDTERGFRLLTDWHKLRAGAPLSFTLSQAPPRVGTNCNPAGPAATAPARQLHANVRKRTHRHAPAANTAFRARQRPMIPSPRRASRHLACGWRLWGRPAPTPPPARKAVHHHEAVSITTRVSAS
jgi:hypothetical protein